MPYRKACEPVILNNIICTIISQPGAGKTSLCSSSNMLLINCDSARVATAALPVDRVEVENWNNLSEILTDNEILSNFNSGKWSGVAIDTFGRAIEFAKFFAARFPGNAFGRQQNLQNKKVGNNLLLTFSGWANVRDLVVTLIRQYQNTFKTDVILTAHAKFYRRDNCPDDMGPKAEGQSRAELLQQSTLVGSLTYWDKTYAEQHADKISFLGSSEEDYKPFGYDNSVLVLDFNQYTAFTSGKNPGRVKPLMVPDLRLHRDWFAMLIQLIKEKINAENVKKAEMALSLETQQGLYNKLATAVDFNNEISTLSRIPDTELKTHLWGMLISTAARKKIFFSRDSKQFTQS